MFHLKNYIIEMSFTNLVCIYTADILVSNIFKALLISNIVYKCIYYTSFESEFLFCLLFYISHSFKYNTSNFPWKLNYFNKLVIEVGDQYNKTECMWYILVFIIIRSTSFLKNNINFIFTLAHQSPVHVFKGFNFI